MEKEQERRASDPVAITPGMVKAGVEAMWGYLEPDESVLRDGVAKIYRAMERARRQSF